MDKITFCIPVKSNLRYLKTCIFSIRENSYRKDHDIIIYVDEDKDGTVEWLNSVKDELNIKFYENKTGVLTGIGKGYDFCIEKSATDIFMIFHADMMLGKNADVECLKHLSEKNVVCCTRIEPPLHPSGPEKIVMDFGFWPEENIHNGFKKSQFNEYVQSHLGSPKITHGCFAPWMMYKMDFNLVGGHDKIFHSYHEDSDIFNRFYLLGYNFIQPWSALVYHLTCRAGIFENGLDKKSERVMEMQRRSLFEFIRKWGAPILHDDHMLPIVRKRYDVGFIIKNCIAPNHGVLFKELEPWCDTIYTDFPEFLTRRYIEINQNNTNFDIRKKIKSTAEERINNILVEFDATKWKQEHYQFIQNFSLIIENTGEIGEFEYDIFKLNIKSMESYEQKLICSNDNWYLSKLKV